MLGMTPASYAKGGKGAIIAYDIVDSPLGRLLVAATAKGLCFLSLGHNDRTLIQELEHEFPQAESITRDQHSIAQSVSVVIDFLEGKIPHAELPLDVRATAFQRRVRSEEHTSELQSLMRTSYAVFCLQKKNNPSLYHI